MRSIGTYILSGHTPVQCDDIYEWGRWMETADRHVAKTHVEGKFISTVFLGLDHSFGGTKPILFETMIFDETKEGRNKWVDEYMDRYTTWEEAEKGHRKAVNMVTKRIRAVGE